VGSDQATHEVFVSEGGQVVIYDEDGNRLSTISGAGAFSGARGVAVRSGNGHVFISSKAAGKIAEFGYFLPAYTPIDHPGVVHGVNQVEKRSFGDFQVTRSGKYAAFDSVMSLTGYENLGNSEVFRYDSKGDRVDCASCAPTLAPAKADTFLSPYGLNLADNGKVFYTSQEALVLHDTNEKLDAYEWNEGKIGLLSTGQGLDDSALLSASEDGRDAFFFTRETLVPEDENGGAVKVYDAREDGGYLQLPTPPPCAASDECHGAGTEAPPPPKVNSLEGPGARGYGPPPSKKACRNGFVKRKGRCVKKRKKHHRRGHRAPKHG
jgi:hypothetical protein